MLCSFVADRCRMMKQCSRTRGGKSSTDLFRYHGRGRFDRVALPFKVTTSENLSREVREGCGIAWVSNGHQNHERVQQGEYSAIMKFFLLFIDYTPLQTSAITHCMRFYMALLRLE